MLQVKQDKEIKLDELEHGRAVKHGCLASALPQEFAFLIACGMLGG
jgi:hypothetical protein